MIAYDSEGEVIGTIAIWIEADDQIHLASDYGDGYAETVVADSRARTKATLPPEVVTARAELVLDRLGRATDPQAGWFECGVAIVSTTAACAAAQPLLCPLGAAATGCTCIPLMIDEFQDIECP